MAPHPDQPMPQQATNSNPMWTTVPVSQAPAMKQTFHEGSPPTGPLQTTQDVPQKPETQQTPRAPPPQLDVSHEIVRFLMLENAKLTRRVEEVEMKVSNNLENLAADVSGTLSRRVDELENGISVVIDDILNFRRHVEAKFDESMIRGDQELNKLNECVRGFMDHLMVEKARLANSSSFVRCPSAAPHYDQTGGSVQFSAMPAQYGIRQRAPSHPPAARGSSPTRNMTSIEGLGSMRSEVVLPDQGAPPSTIITQEQVQREVCRPDRMLSRDALDRRYAGGSVTLPVRAPPTAGQNANSQDGGQTHHQTPRVFMNGQSPTPITQTRDVHMMVHMSPAIYARPGVVA